MGEEQGRRGEGGRNGAGLGKGTAPGTVDPAPAMPATGGPAAAAAPACCRACLLLRLLAAAPAEHPTAAAEPADPPLSGDQPVCGLDIGCGANFIYCLLGAAMYGWCMTGSDISDVAQQWAQRNQQDNPQLAGLLGVRRVEGQVG